MTATATIAPTTNAPGSSTRHTPEIEFSARHLMISNVKGRFSNPVGAVKVDPKKPKLSTSK